MKKIFFDLIVPCSKILVYLIALILFLSTVGSVFFNLLFTIVILLLILDELLKIKNYYEIHQVYEIETELGKISVLNSMIIQLVNKVASNIENIKIEKIDVDIRNNKIFVNLILNVKSGSNFYGIAHNMELAVKQEFQEIMGYDRDVDFIFNIERIIE